MTNSDILQILPSLETGGAEKMVVHLAGELARVGLQPSVVSFFEPKGSQLQRALDANRIPIWSLGKRLGPDFAIIGNLRALIRRLQPDVIHTHLSTLRYVIPSMIGISDPPRIVHTIHRVAERDTEVWLRWLQRWCMRRCMEVIAVSEEVAQSCARIYRQLKVSVIPNGIPIGNRALSSNTGAEIRRSLGIDDDCFVFCCVARLRAVKNHKALLRAFAGITERTGAHLLLAGDGELRDELEALTHELQITEQTHFLGERDDVGAVLAASNAFVLSSLSEGIPFSVLEAMAAGLPVVATSVGGLPEIVRSGTEGLLVPAGSVDALQDAMAHIVFDNESRLTMACAATERVKQRFDARVMVRSYLSTYERLGARVAMGGE